MDLMWLDPKDLLLITDKAYHFTNALFSDHAEDVFVQTLRQILLVLLIVRCKMYI